MAGRDEPRLRRSMLMTPGNRADRLLKAPAYPADCLVFDLEDSVPPAAKAKANARAAVSQALARRRQNARERVRINAFESGFGADDLAGVPLTMIDSIMLPKVESAAGLLEVQRRLEALGCNGGRARPLELIVALETPRGIFEALPIALATPRTTAIFFGSGDYTAATGAAVTVTALLFPRSIVAPAAGAAGIQPIDAAYFQDGRDAQATRQDALAVRALGFAGKVVFHPEQVTVANPVFSPTVAEVDHARRIVAAYSEALASSHGTSLAGGVFVAIDLVAPAERLLRLTAMVESNDGARPSP